MAPSHAAASLSRSPLRVIREWSKKFSDKNLPESPARKARKEPLLSVATTEEHTVRFRCGGSASFRSCFGRTLYVDLLPEIIELMSDKKRLFLATFDPLFKTRKVALRGHF